MSPRLRFAAVLLSMFGGITLAGPAVAEEDGMSMMQQGHSGMMKGGGGMGMMGAQGGKAMMGHGMMAGGGMAMMGPMSGLDLSEEQVQEMTEMHKQMARKHADMMGAMPALRFRLSQELAKEEPDAKRVGELFLQIQQQRRQLMQDRMQMRQQMMQTLTKEQRQQMQEMMENRGQMRMGGDMPMGMGD